MSLNLGVSILGNVNQENDIFASLHPTKEVVGITIAAGQNLKRGACLGGSGAGFDAVLKLWNTADQSHDTLVGILGCDVDATDGAKKGFMYVSGEFLKNRLFATHTIVAGVYNLGSIVIKEEMS